MQRILPYILATLTQHNRQKVVAGVDFQWNRKLWVHNVFRVWELIFWRREGIKAEMSAWVDNGKTYYQCHSWEAIFALAEANIRGAFKWKLPVLVYLPQLATPNGAMFKSPYVFAIATDNHASGNFPGSGGTNSISSYVLSGSNTLLMSHSWGATVPTAAAWGAHSLTVVSTQNSADGSFEGQFVLVGLTGTNNLAVTISNTSMSIGTSYTGVNQSTTPDSFANHTATQNDTATYTTTVVASNCWMFLTNLAQTNSAVASTGSFLRQQGNNVVLAAFDTNGTVGTGSQSMTVVASSGSGNGFNGIISSFAPVAAAVVNSNFLAFM